MSVPDLYTPYKLTQNIAHDVYPAIAPNRPDLAVTGQNILISGGGSGLGLVQTHLCHSWFNKQS